MEGSQEVVISEVNAIVLLDLKGTLDLNKR